MKRKITIFLIITLIILIFRNYNIVLVSVIKACNIWFFKVFPHLFIMIIIQDILLKLDIVNYFKNISDYIFFMSMLSGTPSSAYIISKLVNDNVITKEYGNICLIFTYFANPLFLYTILNLIFKNSMITAKLLIIIYFSNLILYLFYKKRLPTIRFVSNNSNINISSSIKNSIDTNLMVLGTIVFYFIISNLLIHTFNPPECIEIFMRGVLEMTQGLNSLINLNIVFKDVITIFFITFGGLSIHTQVKCILDNANLDYKFFLKGRILQVIITLIITIIT